MRAVVPHFLGGGSTDLARCCCCCCCHIDVVVAFISGLHWPFWAQNRSLSLPVIKWDSKRVRTYLTTSQKEAKNGLKRVTFNTQQFSLFQPFLSCQRWTHTKVWEQRREREREKQPFWHWAWSSSSPAKERSLASLSLACQELTKARGPLQPCSIDLLRVSPNDPSQKVPNWGEENHPKGCYRQWPGSFLRLCAFHLSLSCLCSSPPRKSWRVAECWTKPFLLCCSSVKEPGKRGAYDQERILSLLHNNTLISSKNTGRKCIQNKVFKDRLLLISRKRELDVKWTIQAWYLLTFYPKIVFLQYQASLNKSVWHLWLWQGLRFFQTNPSILML